MGNEPLRYLVDSVIVIDHFNGIGEATRFLAEYGSEIALSVITRAEVLAGFDADSEPLARELLDLFPALPLNAGIADLAGRLRRGGRWKLPDAIQAALAISNELILVTRNTRDFEPGGTPEVIVPYTI